MSDVPRAYFHAKTGLVKLPAEDCSGRDKTSMYGARDAAGNWERDWHGLGRSSRNLFHNKKRKTSGLTHGGDFAETGTKESL